MNNELKNKYFVRKPTNEQFVDITSLFDGIKILSIGGWEELGKTVNVYHEQWADSQVEDFLIATIDQDNTPVVVRENVDLQLTFICGNKYSANAIDVRAQHDAFIEYMTSSDIYIKSAYTGKEVRCMCIENYKPTTERLQRGFSSFIVGVLPLHTLGKPSQSVEPVIGNLYIGFGDDAITSMQEMLSLGNLQHYNKANASGNYTIVCPTLSYLWICTEGTISKVTSNGFEVPMNSPISIGTYRCYRTYHNIKANTTMEFTITVNEE